MSCGARSMTSCAVLLVMTVGLSSAKHICLHSDEEAFQPILSSFQSRRICAALCMSGLGGKACGSECLDLIPNELPGQSLNKSREQHSPQNSMARKDVCPVLCKNRLGYPLCNCEDNIDKNDEIDFVQICGNLCVNFNHHLPGCQSCQVYEDAAKARIHVFAANSSPYDKSLRGVDWDEWCRQMCSVGDGGAACNCDILPMKIEIE